MNDTEKLVEQIITALEDKKGVEIVTMDLRKIDNSFCSFFVVCHGTSSSHVAALADHVDDTLRRELREKPLHIEGAREALWVLIDYGNVVVHVFQKEQRDYYQLEDFWADATITKIEENTHAHGRK